MNLQTLGYDDWFSDHARALLQPGQSVGRVMAIDRGLCHIRGEDFQTSAELSREVGSSGDSGPGFVCAGDWVCVEGATQKLAVIKQVLPRKTFLRRKRPGKTVEFQMLAANLDVALIVQSCHFDFNIRRLERYLVVANDGQVEPIVILTKTDLISSEALDGLVETIRNAGISERILPISNTTGVGFVELQNIMEAGKTFCFLGSSGVGKTTLINRLLNKESYETKPVSATGEGVHTTTRRELVALDNGAILVDTPGMRELGLLGTSDGLEDSFLEINNLSIECRFANCTHTHEPGCAVREAIKANELNEDRYQSYQKLKKESEFNDMSYEQKRKKDKNFGRHIKSVLKHHRK